MEKWIVRIKRVSAVLLFVAMFLPLSRCVRPADTQPPQAPANQAAPGQPAAPQAVAHPEPTITYTYAWTNFRYDEPSGYLIFLAFLWPIPVLLYEAFGRKVWLIKVLLWLQLPLCAGSAWLIEMRSLFEERWVGTYLADFSLALYGLAALAAVVLEIKRLIGRRKGGKAADAPASP